MSEKELEILVKIKQIEITEIAGKIVFEIGNKTFEREFREKLDSSTEDPSDNMEIIMEIFKSLKEAEEPVIQ